MLERMELTLCEGDMELQHLEEARGIAAPWDMVLGIPAWKRPVQG